VGRERLLQRLGLHDVGVKRAAMGDRRDAVLHALLVGMDDQVEPEPASLLVAERDHLAELPGPIDMQQREWRLRGIEGLEREMQHHGRVFADRIEHHRIAELGRDLAHDVNALGLELAEIAREALLHGLALALPSPAADSCSSACWSRPLPFLALAACTVLRSSAR